MHGVYSMIVERAKNCHKFNGQTSEIVNPNIKLLHLGGLEVQARPHKNQVQST